MDAFRNQGLKSAIYGTLVVAMGIVFVVQFGKQGPLNGPSKTECVAEVRGTCVSPRDMRSSMALVQASGRLEEKDIKALQLRRRVVDGLVERTLLNQDAARLGVSISDDDLNDELIAGHALLSLGVETGAFIEYQLGFRGDRTMRLLPVKVNGQFDKKTYAKSLRMYVGQGEAEYREMQRAEQIAARMRDLVRSRVRISEDEAFDAFSREKSTASIKFVKVSRTWLARYVLPSSQEALDAFTASHKDQIETAYQARKAQYGEECRRARHILIKASHAASDEEKADARKRIDEAAEKLKKGASFEELAREISEDTSASEGGDLGCVQAGKMVKPFEDATFALKAGETSAVIETEYGFHIIRLDGIYKGAELEAQARREIAREQMLTVESETKAAELGKAILAEVAKGATLEDATSKAVDVLLPETAKGTKRSKALADAEAPKVQEAKDFTAEGTPLQGVDAASVAFTLKNPGDVAPDLLKLDNGYAILQLTERKAASREAFEKDRERYVDGLRAAKQHDALIAYVNRLREAAKSEIKVNQAFLADKSPEEGGE